MLTLHTLFPELAVAARSSLASFPLKVQISPAPAALQGRWAFLAPPPYFVDCVSPALAFLSISTTFFPSVVCLWCTPLQHQAWFFHPLVKMINWKYFFPGGLKTYLLIFPCLLCFLEKQSFRIGWKILLDLYEKNLRFLPKFSLFLFKEVFQNKTVTAKSETTIVHLLQIISPFFPHQKRAWCTRKVNPPQTMRLWRQKSIPADIFLPFCFFLFFTYFSLQSFAHYQMPSQSPGEALGEVPAHGKVCWTAAAQFAPRIACSHRTPKKIAFFFEVYEYFISSLPFFLP